MNLDDLDRMRALDAHDMLAEIDSLPDQLLLNLWSDTLDPQLPPWDDLDRVIMVGMGGSAIAADLLSRLVTPVCAIPVMTWRDYGLPAWAASQRTLVILCSHSGNTEETLSAFQAAVENDCRILAITTGGTLAGRARALGAPLWIFSHAGQPRAAVGIVFALLVKAFTTLGLIPQLDADILGCVNVLREQRELLTGASPVFRNPAKRMAGQLMGRWVTIFGSDILEPVARRWKTQINELAKAWAQFEFLPEADHNTLAGLTNPDTLQSQMMALFLRAGSSAPRSRLRSDLTREVCMISGMNTDFYDAPGNTPLAQMWSALQFGDYTAYYLAIAYGIDPTLVEVLEQFKQALNQPGEAGT